MSSEIGSERADYEPQPREHVAVPNIYEDPLEFLDSPTNEFPTEYTNTNAPARDINIFHSIVPDPKHNPLTNIGPRSFENNLTFLAPNECLIYVKNTLPFSDTEGTVQIARVQKSGIMSRNREFSDLILTTDADGDQINDPFPITVPTTEILTNRPRHDIKNQVFYHFPVTDSIMGTSFVIKKNITNSLESTSRNGLGSGIYGKYIEDPDTIGDFLTDPNQIVYEIPCNNPYIIQDKEHGDSITVASLTLNRYLDRIIPALRKDYIADNNNYQLSDYDVDFSQAQTLIEINKSPNLLTLWNIVLYQTGDNLTQSELDLILADYVANYLNDNTLVDSINGEPIYFLPINSIMRFLGYDGLLADDVSNNRWDRGCVSFNYTQSNIIQGSIARY